MFKLKSFSVNLVVITEGNKNAASVVVIIATNNKVRLINSFTGEIFWEYEDRVKHKYVLDGTDQVPKVIYTYSEFEYKLRTLVVEYGCSDLLSLDIFKHQHPISKFFVHEFAKQLGSSSSFEEIGHYDILSYDEWIEIFTAGDCMSERYECYLTDIRETFMRYNRLAPKIWKYLHKNNIYVTFDMITYRTCNLYMKLYAQNPYLDCNDVIINYFNGKSGHFIDWNLITKNVSIGKEFFIKYRCEFRDESGMPLNDYDYWIMMSSSPNIDTDEFIDYINSAVLTLGRVGDIWHRVLYNVDLTNKGVIAYIEANPLKLTTYHFNNPTMTNRWIKHIINNVMNVSDETWEYLQPRDCMTTEDLIGILDYMDTHDGCDCAFIRGDMIFNPNVSDQFIEERIFKVLDNLIEDDEIHALYAHPRVNEYFIEKYILTSERMKSLAGFRALSQNPNFNESHLQIICTAIDVAVADPLGHFGNLSYFDCLDLVEIIANPKISMETLIKHAARLVDLKTQSATDEI